MYYNTYIGDIIMKKLDNTNNIIVNNDLIIKLDDEIINKLLLLQNQNKMNDFEDKFFKFLNQYINNKSQTTTDKDCQETEVKTNTSLIKKIQKWMDKKNSVPYFIIKSFFECLKLNLNNANINSYNCKKGKMRDIFCSYDRTFTKELFDRNIKLLCTSSKSAYGNIFNIRRNREDEYNSLIKPSDEVLSYMISLFEEKSAINKLR